MTMPPHRQPPAAGGAPKAPVTPPQLQAPVDPNAAAATAHANAASAHANAAAAPDGPPAAAPQLSEGDQSAMNDDWTKVTTWDVTDASGAPVTTLDQLADVLGTDRTSAASMLLASPMSASAPPELLAEADAEVNPDGSGGLAGEFDDSTDTDTSADTGGDGSDPAADPAAAEDAADGGADDDIEDPQGNPISGKSIRAGHMVTWHGGMGRVELVASNGGTIPGVPDQVVGTKSDPACRVRVYEQVGGQWKPSRQRIAVKAAHLVTTPAPRRVQTKDATAQLVLLTAQHAGLPGTGKPTADAIKAVFDRGQQSWPGEKKTLLSAQEWAIGRVRAFVAKAEGGEVEHYIGDDDLLP